MGAFGFRASDVVDFIALAKELAIQMEADKHRDQPELLEVRVLLAAEELEEKSRKLLARIRLEETSGREGGNT